MPSKLPTIRDLASLFRALKPEIGDEYRAFEMTDDEAADCLPSMCVTIGWTPEDGSWSYQTGDNSYTGGAYGHPHWAVVALERRTNSRALAREVREQLMDLAYA